MALPGGHGVDRLRLRRFWFCMMVGFGGWGMLLSSALLQFLVPAVLLDLACVIWANRLYRQYLR